MCGISGIVSLSKPLQSDLIRKMNQVQRLRGPDDEGVFGYNIQNKRGYNFYTSESQIKKGYNLNDQIDGLNIYFGHRRLSVIDTTSAGHQPMEYKSGELVIVFNGEIYNYKELKIDLIRKGHVFKTNTDTEVILASYNEWGENCCKYFNGDWAFCILDIKRNSLFLSRDRNSIKPIYYYYNYDLKLLAFASEIKALFQLPFVSRSINKETCFEFLISGISDHSKETMFNEIKQLESGNNMTINLESLRLKNKQYYKLEYCASFGTYSKRKAFSYADNIRELLIDSVRLRLRADVPIGTCLSGGLDSSSIAVIINKLMREEGMTSEQIGEKQKTFTASYPHDPIDETKYVSLLVKQLNTDSYFTYPTDKKFVKVVEKMIWNQDEPFGDPSIYAQYEVMKLASSYVTVILDGQGGDELFGGYNHFKTAYFSQLINNRMVDKFFNEMLNMFKKHNSVKQLIRELKGLPMFLLPMKIKTMLYLFWNKNRNKDYNRGFCNNTRMVYPYVSSFTPNLNSCLYFFQAKYNLPRLLHYEDRNSMYFSLESRTPFTDYRLADYVFSIPAVYKFNDGWSKWLLRLAMRDMLPKEILWRKSKIGFEVPAHFQNFDRNKLFNIWENMVNNPL